MRRMDVLMVDDSPTDVLLAREALRCGGAVNRLHAVSGGEEALQFLRRQGAYSGAARPDVILLDLNLTGGNGHEVLAEIKSDPDLSVIPVVVLSSSRAGEDVMEAYRRHANCYVAKPLDFARFGEILRSIEHFWINVAILPEAGA